MFSYFHSSFLHPFNFFNNVLKTFRIEILLGSHCWTFLSHKYKQNKSRFLFATSFMQFSLSCCTIIWRLLLSFWFVITPNSLQTHYFHCLLHSFFSTVASYISSSSICRCVLDWLGTYFLSMGSLLYKIFIVFHYFYFSLVPNHWWKCWVVQHWRAPFSDAFADYFLMRVC